jgi:hypothetical protein
MAISSDSTRSDDLDAPRDRRNEVSRTGAPCRLALVCVLAVGLPFVAGPTVSAQPSTSVGVLVPMNFVSIETNLGAPPGVLSGTRRRLGFGAYGEFTVRKDLSLRVEASIVGRGGPLARGVEGTSELRSDYGEFPILLSWHRPVRSVDLFLRGGGVLAFVGARGVGFEGSSETQTQFPLRSTDLAVAGGVGVGKRRGRIVTALEVRGYRSLRSVTDVGRTHNQSIGIQFSVGISR